MQSTNSLLAVVELVPSGHALHAPTPVTDLYDPTPQAVHSTPSDVALYPVTHVQSVNRLLPGRELVQLGHAQQSPIPLKILNVPATHGMHSADPVEPGGTEVPVGHNLQFVFPGTSL